MIGLLSPLSSRCEGSVCVGCGDDRTSIPAVVEDLGRWLTLPAAVCRLIVVIGVICWSVCRASI